MGERRLAPPLRLGMELSILIHLGTMWALTHRPGRWMSPPVWAPRDPVEVDLTRPFRLTSDPKLAFRSAHPGTGAPRVEKPTPQPFKPGGGVAAKGVDWTLPGTGTKVLETPTETGHLLSTSTAPSTGTGLVEGDSQGLGGLGTGGEGEVDWVYLTEVPRLINRDDLTKIIHDYYPPAERSAGREGRVTVEIHLNSTGGVSQAQVAASAGPLFDEAAIKISSLAKFSPARAGDRAVAVKFHFPIDFQLAE